MGKLLERWALCVLVVLSLAACGEEPGAGGGQECAEPLRGTGMASPEVASALGVASYRYVNDYDGTGISISVLNADDVELGTIAWAAESDRSDGGPSTVTASIVMADGATASLWQGIVDPPENELETTELLGFPSVEYTASGVSLRADARALEDGQRGIEYVVPVSDVATAPSGGVGVSFLDGPAWVKTIVIDGTEADREGLDVWLSETGRDVIFEDSAMVLLLAVLSETTLLQTIRDQFVDCVLDGVGESSEALVGDVGAAQSELSSRALACGKTLFAPLACYGCVAALVASGGTLGWIPCTGCALGVLSLPDSLKRCVCGEMGEDCCQPERCGEGCGRCGGYCDNGVCKCKLTSICCYRECPKCTSCGEPHLLNFDETRFDFQGRGEYVLTESTDGSPFAIQARQVGREESGLCGQVTWNTAVTVQLDEHRVEVRTTEPRLLIDGVPVELAWQERVTFGTESFVLRDQEHAYYLLSESGDVVYIEGRSILDLSVQPAESRRGRLRGLLGNFDGEDTDDLIAADGTVYDVPVAFDELYEWGDTWRVTAENSLFTYASDEGPDTFVGPNPVQRGLAADLPEAERATAEAVCRGVGIEDERLPACIFDVVCLGEGAEASALRMATGTEALRIVERPDFEGFVAEGATSGVVPPGTPDDVWTVASPSLVRINRPAGEPAFFVAAPGGPRYYRATLEFNTASATEGALGFVVGYQRPVATNGDGPNDYGAFVISWLGEQDTTVDGVVGPEGLTIAYVDATIAPADLVSHFWGQTEGSGYQVLATDHGAGRGWDNRTEYDVEVIYAADRIEATFTSRTESFVIAVQASDAPVPFGAGRFGLYSYRMRPGNFANLEIEVLE